MDRISVSFLRDLGDDFAQKIAEATNRAIESGYYAISLKIARVTPLFKGGTQNLRCNYRPVSVNSNLSKVSENVIYTRLYDFATTNQLVSEYQFGFQKGSSTTSATLTRIHKCIDSIEAKRYTALVFIDVQKAFDCVNHEVLMEKLEMLGVRGPLYTLISDYLFSRKQRIQVGDERSEF